MAGRQLVFVQQPTRVRIPNAIWPPVRLEVRIGDRVDPRVIDGEVKLSILSGPPGGQIIGTSTARCPNGVATFDDLRFSVPGTYTLLAECDEDKLELIPRPLSYRYFGNFNVTENEQVQIAGDGVTTGVVFEVGEGWIVIQDDSSTPQQSVVAGANDVEIEGILGKFEATDWFAADAPGIDMSGSAAVWTVKGLEAVEALGRFGSMVPEQVAGRPPIPIFNIPSPLGPDKALVADDSAARYALTADGDVPEIDVCPVGEPGTTFLILGTYPPPGISVSPALAEFATAYTGSKGSVSLRGYGSDRMAARFGNANLTTAIYIQRRSKRSWYLIGLRVFRVGTSQRRIDIWVDGYFHGTSTDNFSGGSPSVLRQVRHMITTQTSFSQIGVYEGARDPEWHLEQARRCGVAP